MWDYKTGLPFQTMTDLPQPGSLDAEAGIFCSTFDQTGSRLITGGADKTIKVSLFSFSFSSLTIRARGVVYGADAMRLIDLRRSRLRGSVREVIFVSHRNVNRLLPSITRHSRSSL